MLFNKSKVSVSSVLVLFGSVFFQYHSRDGNNNYVMMAGSSVYELPGLHPLYTIFQTDFSIFCHNLWMNDSQNQFSHVLQRINPHWTPPAESRAKLYDSCCAFKSGNFSLWSPSPRAPQSILIESAVSNLRSHLRCGENVGFCAIDANGNFCAGGAEFLEQSAICANPQILLSHLHLEQTINSVFMRPGTGHCDRL